MVLRYRVRGGERMEDSAIPGAGLLCRISFGYEFRRTAPVAAAAVHAAARAALRRSASVRARPGRAPRRGYGILHSGIGLRLLARAADAVYAAGPVAPSPAESLPALPVPTRKGRTVSLWLFGVLGFVLIALVGYFVWALGSVASAVGLVLALIPLTIVFLGVRMIDRWEPEPKRLVAFAILWELSPRWDSRSSSTPA